MNGRGLDIRVNVPNGLEALERVAKAAAGERFHRGSVQVSLRIDVSDAAGADVNAAALDALMSAFEARNGGPASGVELATLIAARGVLDSTASGGQIIRELAEDKAAIVALTVSLGAALDDLAASRLAEGASLKTLLADLLDQMTGLHAEALRHAAEQPGLLRDRLVARLAELKAEDSVDADRLAAEAALAAAKADVREELDRLATHIATGHDHLAAAGAIGRKLDFLAQEMNREANTLCSKSASIELTNVGLGLKAVIDQFKEQAANVE